MPAPTSRPARRLFALSLRVLMFLIVVLAVVLAWYTNRARSQARTLAVLLANGVQIQFDYGYPAVDAKGRTNLRVQSLGPGWMRWLRRNMGDEYFRKPVFIIWNPTSPSGIRRKVAARSVPESYDDEVMRRIGWLDGPKEITLLSSTLTDAGLAHLSGLREIESIRLLNCTNVTDEGFEHIAGLPALKGLSILRSQTTDSAFASFGKMRQLERFYVDGSFSGAGLGELRGLTRLESLSLSSSALDETTLARLGELPRLKKLSLWSRRITDAGLRSLATLRGLEALHLRGCQLTDEGMASLVSLEKLRELEITPAEGQFTDRALQPLHRLAHLEALSIGDSRGKTTDFSDQALVALVQALPALKSLFLERTLITSELIDQLQSARPGLSVQAVR